MQGIQSLYARYTELWSCHPCYTVLRPGKYIVSASGEEAACFHEEVTITTNNERGSHGGIK